MLQRLYINVRHGVPDDRWSCSDHLLPLELDAPSFEAIACMDLTSAHHGPKSFAE